jgi:hypothetical protein
MFLMLALSSGCGGSEHSAAPPRPDRAKDTVAIQARVATYVRLMLAGDGSAACGQLTPEYRKRTDQRAQAAGIAGCAEAFSIYGEAVDGAVPDGFAEQASDPRRIAVILRGDRAEAAMRSPRGGLSIKRTVLQRVGTRWLIDDLGVTRPRHR